MSHITINGQVLEFHTKETIVELAKKAGIFIPTLCYLPKSGNNNVCRICSVQVEGHDHFVPACATNAVDGMIIHTETPEIVAFRKHILTSILEEGRHDCFLRKLPKDSCEYQSASMNMPHREHSCPKDGRCELQDLVLMYQIPVKNIIPEENTFPLDDTYPMITRDFSKCIQCGRCASACDAIQGNLAIPYQFGRRAEKDSWWPIVDYDKCTHCGECLQLCPTGALSAKKAYGLSTKKDIEEGAIEKIRTTCPYCGVGCQQELSVKDGRIIEVNGVEKAEPNMGSLCVKGRFGYDFIYSKDRLTMPLIRQEDGEFKEASWDEALSLIASKFSQIIEESGPDALAGVSCSRSINEDSYQMQKLFRTVFKTNNIDNCART